MDRQVKTAATGRHTVSGVKGLHIDVSDTGRSRSWFLRIQHNGKRHDIGLGPYPEVTLTLARERALAKRREIIVEKIAPLAHRQAMRGMTFRQAAEACIELKAADWKNAKHRQQWTNTLAEYAFPLIGDRDVSSIETTDVLAVLKPIWSSKAETAARLRQRIEIVMSYATAAGARSGLNPARWKDNLAALLPKMSKAKRVKHHAALPWSQAAEFMTELQKHRGERRPRAAVRGPHRLPKRRSPAGDLGRDRPQHGNVGDPCPAHEGAPGAPDTAHARCTGRARAAGRE